MKSVYLDNAATSFPKPPGVAEKMVEYITKIGSNVNRGSYDTAYEAEETVFETRTLIKELFNGPDERNVVFTSGITLSLNMVLKGLLSEGDHVIVCPLPHNAVMRPVRQLEKEGAEVTLAGLSLFDGSSGAAPESFFLPEAFEKLLKINTKAVVMTHGSNVSGRIFPLREMGDFCREHGLYFIVDAAQTAGVCEIDMERDNIDALCFTGHKGLLGPQGIGGFVLSDRIVHHINPLISGGTGSISHLETVPDFLPDRFEPGTPNLPGIFGLWAGLSFLKEVGIDEVYKKEEQLSNLFISQIKDIKGLKVIGHEENLPYTGVVSVSFDDFDPAEAAAILESDFGIKTRVGLHCSPAAHKALNTYPRGTVRFSFGYFNSEEDAIYAAEELKEILK